MKPSRPSLVSRATCPVSVFLTALTAAPAFAAPTAKSVPPVSPDSTTPAGASGVSAPGGNGPASNATAGPTASPSRLPTPDAATALTRATAAYEYGDIEEMVAAARLVSEGSVRPVSSAERVQALRLLGIGLYLLDRREGAEAAFYELLRLRPDSRLDPRTTRPDVVAFFSWLRQRHEEELRAMQPPRRGPEAGWMVLLPPVGQFANGERGLGLAIGTLEVVSLGTAVTSWALFKSWLRSDGTAPGHESDANALKVVNGVAWAAFLATYVFGVAEAALYRPSQTPREESGFAFDPSGVRWRF